MAKIFKDFSEIEKEVAEKSPPITYKYRDWRNKFHQSLITANTIWFAHPKDLNDPYDIRTPVRFDFTEVNNPIFYNRLMYHARARFPHIDPKSREFRVVCENKFDLIKNNPKEHFEKNYQDMRESDLYDTIGVFSLTGDCLNETMWAHYGNNGSGFCVGFDTVELVRETGLVFGFVEYKDQPPLHSFIVPIQQNQKNQMFLKHTKWGYETEYRLLTLRIASDKDRSVNFNSGIIKEVVLGSKISNEHKNEIIDVLKHRYHGSVRLFETSANTSAYGLQRNEIKY